MSNPTAVRIALFGCGLALVMPSLPAAQRASNTRPVATSRSTLAIALWRQDKPAFGVFVPLVETNGKRAVYSRESGEVLAKNPLYDFVFLNLERAFDAGAIQAIAQGLRSLSAVGRKTLIVRIPSIDSVGAGTTKARVKEALDLGADGVTIPHVRDVDEAKLAISFFRESRANVWSPSNPSGDTIAMLMVEDPGAVAQANLIADVTGVSILACGIGSLTQALGGDRGAAEAGTQRVLAETRRAKLVNMLTASPQDVEKRVKEGFLALLAQGQSADETIRLGRAAAGR